MSNGFFVSFFVAACVASTGQSSGYVLRSGGGALPSCRLAGCGRDASGNQYRRHQVRKDSSRCSVLVLDAERGGRGGGDLAKNKFGWGQFSNNICAYKKITHFSFLHMDFDIQSNFKKCRREQTFFFLSFFFPPGEYMSGNVAFGQQVRKGATVLGLILGLFRDSPLADLTKNKFGWGQFSNIMSI